MKRIIAALAGLLAALSIVVAADSHTGPVETPPCAACEGAYAKPAMSSAPVAVADIANHLHEHIGEVLRITGAFHNDGGRYYLGTGTGDIPVTLDDRVPSCRGQLKTLAVEAGLGTWYDGEAQLIAIGRIEHLRNGTAKDATGIALLCIEQVRPASPSIGSRIRYAMRRVL